MNVLLATSAAPKKSPFFTSEKRPPLGLGSIISVLREAGHKVFFIDNYLQPSRFIENGFLQKYKIDLVGISANTVCFHHTLKMFDQIEGLRKKGLWRGKIIVGGPHATVCSHKIPDFVDHIVEGEGENGILRLVNGQVKERLIREPRMKNLDSLPFQPWDLFTRLPYDTTCSWMNVHPVATMNTSRGCPFDCTFCSVGFVWGQKYTYFSAERIVAEIEYLIEKYQIKGIYFREDNFTANLTRTIKFCETLLTRNIKLSWACETRVSNLPEEVLKLMSAAGCKAVFLGIESGSQRILNIINKGITVEQIASVVTWCKKYDIKTYCSLLTGLPGETFSDYLMTREMLNRLQPYQYGFNVFVGIPGSMLYEHTVQNNTYEYRDDLGLIYPPGYDIKTKYFYGIDSKRLVNYRFKERTDYDFELMRELHKVDFNRLRIAINNNLELLLPHHMKLKIKKYKKRILGIVEA